MGTAGLVAPMWFGGAEGGDTDFWCAAGYIYTAAFAAAGVRTGMGHVTSLIEWIAKQPWCNGNVGMIGISAFGGAQFEAAAQQPPSLKAIFPTTRWAPTANGDFVISIRAA